MNAQKLSSAQLNTVQELIVEKHKLEASNEIRSTYKLQIYSGSLEEAEDTLKEFKKLELDISSKIIYQTPYYKIWVGNFRNRIQADRVFESIRSDYPNTLIIRPSK